MIKVIKPFYLQLARKLGRSSVLYPSLMKFLFKHSNAEEVFYEIFKSNIWHGEFSSGPGADILQAQVLTDKLPGLFNHYGIETVLDIPCGDFNWMKLVNLNNVNYIGADIVKEIIEKNESLYKKKNISFHCCPIKNEGRCYNYLK